MLNRYKSKGAAAQLKRSIVRNTGLYVMSLPVVIYFIIFSYLPMYGVQIAFRNYSLTAGITTSPWVGLEHLKVFYQSYYFGRLIKNTLFLSLYSLLVGIPAPIILALMFQEVRRKKLRSVLQAISYAPNFFSTVVACGMIVMFLAPNTGVIPVLMEALGLNMSTSILTNKDAFRHIYVWSGIWQNVGWSSLIYTAAISGIPTDQYEAAAIEGASHLQQIIHITLPNLAPTITILSILAMGGVMSVGYEKVYLLQNDLNLETSEVISTYVFKTGLLNKKPRYSFSAMVGLFNSVVNLFLLSSVNMLSRRISETSLW
ncbi:MAG: sugar ABC transporter permease [Clostridia bacterium]|nr:sugar ABC transporter permease [Clostridia bacterium]